jgi:hypothetical protein
MFKQLDMVVTSYSIDFMAKIIHPGSDGFSKNRIGRRNSVWKPFDYFECRFRE